MFKGALRTVRAWWDDKKARHSGRPHHGVATPTAAQARMWEAPASASGGESRAEASPAPPSPAVQVVRRVPSDSWEWIECLRDPDPHLVARRFLPAQEHGRADIVRAFGTATPPSGCVLLHYAGDPPPRDAICRTPVILVHGAGTDGDFFVDPGRNGKTPGLARHLRAMGHPTYALTFAHNQDDNYSWARQLANAITRVRYLTGAPKVDLVAHSKGGVPTRMYLSSFRETWMEPYRDDVRRAVFLASPFGGIDYVFRHPSANIPLFLAHKSNLLPLNAPMSWEGISLFPFRKEAHGLGLSQEGPDYWPGQRQLLDRWDSHYPLPLMEIDASATYHGGSGLVGHSRGIDHYIEQSDHFMRRLQETPIDGRVEIAILAGDNADIPGMLNERTGASDGLLLVASAVKVPRGARVLALEVLPMNHLQLAIDPRACQWVSDILTTGAPRSPAPETIPAGSEPATAPEGRMTHAPVEGRERQANRTWTPICPG